MLAVSVKGLAKSDWEAGRSASQWTFEVPEDLFQGQAHVRLRGLGLAVRRRDRPRRRTQRRRSRRADKRGDDACQPQGFWSASVSVPPSATVPHISGAASELDQKSLPDCYFGRVADRDSSQEPEIAGIGATHNASPIGKQWKLALSPKSTDGWPTSIFRTCCFISMSRCAARRPEAEPWKDDK